MEILINITDAKEINRIPHIRELIVLCYMVNTNESARDQFLRISTGSDTNASMRDRIYGIIQLSSLTYEGMVKADSVLKKISDIIPKNLHPEIAWLRKEIKLKNSFYGKVLTPIRNELGFHFSHSLANLPLHKNVPHIPPVLAHLKDENDSELVYVLPTEIVSSYLLSLISEPTNPIKRLEWLIKQLGVYNNRIGSLLREGVYAIMKDIEPKLQVK